MLSVQANLFTEAAITPVCCARARVIATRLPQRTEPERTLFGIVETKAQARKRAQEMVRLIGAIEDAPVAIQYREQHIDALCYFIERSKKVELDPNDLDGLVRMVGDTQGLLTDGERRAMHKKHIWRVYPLGWIGTRPGQMYPAAMHPKEIRYLRKVQDELREEIKKIAEGVEISKVELEVLRAVGPLPEDVAQRYSLTSEGYSARPKEEPLEE